MSHMQVPGDPTHIALNQLVTSGQLSPERAQAAYDASQGRTPGRRLLPTALRLDTLVVGFGSTLLGAALVISTIYSREDGDLDWSNYAVGIVSTLGLLVIAAAAFLLVADPVRKANLMGWPGALGAAGAGLMLGLALDDSGATAYVMGLAVLALSALGYFLIREAPFIITAIVGLGLVYGQALDDLFDLGSIDGDNFGTWIGLALLGFALAVTIGGWFLPTRDLSTILVGAFTAFGFLSLMISLLAAGLFLALSTSMSFDPMSPDGSMGSESSGPSGPDEDVFHNDVWFIIVFTLVMVAVWTACWWLRGHEGYRVLSLFAIASVIPAATVVLAVDSPSWWGVVLAVLGGVALVFAALRALGILGGTPAGHTPY
ncbi:MAG: hypothetical protein L0H93_06645 [Nocardioides sp.]|nr:hypothetical protein [Nocardioides sp.]